MPTFQVDPAWPTIPNNWQFGQVASVAVDDQDHVWVLQRPGTLGPEEQGRAAPPLLEFDEAGRFVQAWGGPDEGYEWPSSEHGVYVDQSGYVWIGGNGDNDHQILKFTKTGQFVMQIGRAGQSQGNGDTQNLNRPADAFVHAPTNELFVADGYGNRRVIVFDADTGEYKRHWGAYGNRPDDADTYNATRGGVDKTYDPTIASKQFGRAVHGIALSRDGMVYVADRTNNRVQAFKTDGTYVGEGFIDRQARGFGSAFDVAVSADPEQQFLYVADGMNQRVVVLRRDTLQIVSRFGTGGPYPGGFYAVHALATDSQGNLYTGETLHGRRVQRWVYKGTRPRTVEDQ